MVEVFIIRLHGHRLPERLMRPIGVVEALEFGQLDAQLAGAGLVELAAVGRVGALDAAVAIGASGRQHEQRDAAPLAGGLEPGRGHPARALKAKPVEQRELVGAPGGPACV